MSVTLRTETNSDHLSIRLATSVETDSFHLSCQCHVFVLPKDDLDDDANVIVKQQDRTILFLSTCVFLLPEVFSSAFRLIIYI